MSFCIFRNLIIYIYIYLRFIPIFMFGSFGTTVVSWNALFSTLWPPLLSKCLKMICIVSSLVFPLVSRLGSSLFWNMLLASPRESNSDLLKRYLPPNVPPPPGKFRLYDQGFWKPIWFPFFAIRIVITLRSRHLTLEQKLGGGDAPWPMSFHRIPRIPWDHRRGYDTPALKWTNFLEKGPF